MYNQSKEIKDMVERLPIGHSIDINQSTFRESFKVGIFNTQRTPTERFLSSIRGSCWGRVTVKINYERYSYTITKHWEECPPDARLIFVESDREWIYKKMPDGSYVYDDS